MARQPGILITRPLDQIEELAGLITRAGGRPVPFPLLTIEPIPASGRNLPSGGIETFHLAVFVSRNAVRFGFDCLTDASGKIPSGLILLAAGAGTAAELESRGAVARYPERADSEGLLEMVETREVRGKRVLIVRGVGGRQLLAATLKSRGATVDYVEVYKREPHPWSEEHLTQLLKKEDVRLVLISSSESLDHFHRLMAASESGHAFSLLVSSERIAGRARDLGYASTLVARGATSEAMSEGVVAWLRSGGNAG